MEFEKSYRLAIFYSIFVLVGNLLVFSQGARATSITTVWGKTDLETLPSIIIRSIGPDSPLYLRINAEIINDDPSCSLKIVFPLSALHVWWDAEQNKMIEQKSVAKEGSIWLTFDVDESTSYPVRRIRGMGPNPLDKDAYSGKGTDWTNEINIPPRKKCLVILDCEYPKNPMPSSCILHIRDLAMGCGKRVSVKKNLPLHGIDSTR